MLRYLARLVSFLHDIVLENDDGIQADKELLHVCLLDLKTITQNK
jgi:hypothetical protein